MENLNSYKTAFKDWAEKNIGFEEILLQESRNSATYNVLFHIDGNL